MALSEQVRTAVIEALRGGMSYRSAAEQFGTSLGTIARIAQAAGIPQALERAHPPAEPVADYISPTERRALINEMLNKVRALGRKARTSLDVWRLAVAGGIWTDKARLESGESTSRAAVVHEGATRVDERLARIRERLAKDGTVTVAAIEVRESGSRGEIVPQVFRQPDGSLVYEGENVRIGPPRPSNAALPKSPTADPATIARLQEVRRHAPDIARRVAAVDELRRLGVLDGDA